MKRFGVTGAALGWLALGPAGAAAQQVVVKMATLVPEGSSWHLILKENAEKWKTVSGGRVVVRLYPGGAAGAHPDGGRSMPPAPPTPAPIPHLAAPQLAPPPPR